MGSLSCGWYMDGKPVYLWLLVDGGDYFVCRMYGKDSQDTGYGLSCFCDDSVDSGSCAVSDHELDDDAGVGEVPGRWDLHNSFCCKYGSRNDADDDPFSDGMELEISAEVDVRKGIE